MRFVIQKLIPNSSHKDLSLRVTPFQNPRTISKTDGFNGVRICACNRLPCSFNLGFFGQAPIGTLPIHQQM
jgi:hypothetical protein